MNRSLNLGAEKEKVGNLWQVTVLTCILVFIACLAFTATSAFADEGKAKASINWGSPNPNSLIPNPSLSEDPDREISTDGSRVAMFRLYNRWTGEHFYTSSKSERDDIVKAGWVYEQIEWYAPTSEDYKPVYRLYNRYVEGGDHHYTTSSDEKDECVKAGWTYEGEGWRTVEAGATDYVKVLRQYNPYATTGTHNYTTDEDEQKYLVSLGWRAEADGGWGGYSTLEPSTPTPTTKEIDFAKAVVDTADKTYTSEAITPKATVTGLTAGTDYVVTYSDNVNAGTATIKIEGKGDYTGSKEWSFKINPLNISNATVTLGESLTYNATEQTQTVTKVVAGSITLATSDYEVSGNKQVKAGNHKLTIKGKGNFGGSVNKDFEIAKLDISDSTVTLGTALTYNGSEQTQNVASVKVGNLTVPDADYAVSNNKQTKAGTYALKVAGVGKNVTGECQVEFSIEQATPEAPTGLTATAYTDQTLAYVALPTLPVGFDGTLTWKDTSTSTGTSEGTITAPAIYTPTDKNYKAVEVAVTVTVEKNLYWFTVAGAEDPRDEAGILKAQSEIDEDMKVLHGEKDKTLSGKDKTAVEEEYTYYMNGKSADGTEDQEVRLYTKWNTATGESGSADITGKNSFVEFRIIKVGEHDGDGSAVTFMATHSLPTAQQMNSENTNAGSWADSLMRNTTMSTYVKGGLSDLCTIDESTGAKTINKVTTSGSYGSWVENSTTADQFWLLSQTEVFGTAGNTLVPTYFKSTEGTQYDWFVAKGVNAKSAWDTTNTAIRNMNLTRSGSDPARSGGSGSAARCWLRSPVMSSSENFGRVGGSYGNPTSGSADYSFSVVPAFCF